MLNQVFKSNIPLAARMRPKTLSDYVGQKKLVGKNGIIRQMIKKGELFSMIFWGPPGSGKTTLAEIIANETNSQLFKISAVESGKEEMRSIILKLQKIREIYQQDFGFQNKKFTNGIIFIDEIHRFNKAQQDYLLPFVENGTVILIGATTENPSFEVISPLLSRLKVFVLERYSIDEIKVIIKRAVKDKENGFGKIHLKFERNALDLIANLSNGDPRNALNTLEIAVSLSKIEKNSVILTCDSIKKAAARPNLLYDKKGEEHYNLISALHKSIRSSNASAGLYWLARILEAGEDPLYVARRLLRASSEDIGNADFRALLLANAVFDACAKVGMPECAVFLSQLVIYLARAPKDNSAYIGYEKAKKDALETLNLEVPLHLRNAVTKLMKNLGYGKGYVYDHDLPNKVSGQECFPEKLKGRKYL